MTFAPSTIIKKEFAVTCEDERARLLAESLGGARYGGQLHLTPARARKAAALYALGFSAVRQGREWCYQRGGSRLLTLDHAMMVVEVMQ